MPGLGVTTLDQARHQQRTSEHDESRAPRPRRVRRGPPPARGADRRRDGAGVEQLLLTVTCPCSVVFERLVTLEDAELDLLEAAFLN
jgi:hypothetical protein